VLRKEWLAALVALLLVSLLTVVEGPDHLVVNVTFDVIIWGMALLLLIRFGLLPFMMALCINNFLEVYPLTTHFSVWYAGSTIFVFSIILAAAIFGFYTSTAGKPLFGGISLDS
jgi:hypothetical protein